MSMMELVQGVEEWGVLTLDWFHLGHMIYMKLPLALSQQLDTLYRPFSNLLVRPSIDALETHYDLVN